MREPDAIVVGGGAIGLAIAWRAAQRGLEVLVLDAGEPGAGASRVAAGMLAPGLEVEAAPRPLLELGRDSAARYPAFAAELERATGLDAGYRRNGSLALALSSDDVAALRRELAYGQALGVPLQWLTPAEVREREPHLAPGLRGAMLSPEDHQADPRRLVPALLVAARRAGAEVRAGARVDELVCEGGAVAGVRCGGELLRARRVVLAAGAYAGVIEGVPPAAIRPVKGQILRLRGPAPLLRHSIAAPGVYLVPRDDGELVVGATVEEQGFDTTVTAGGVLELLRAAFDVLPGVAELALEEAVAGLRPGSVDNMPLLGEGGPDGLVWACGHFRNGILLTPATADLLAELLATGEAPPELAPFAPGRALALESSA